MPTKALDASVRHQPSAAIVDSQSVKAAETVGAGTRGFDAGKKINGRKRHIAVDVEGLLLAVVVTAASIGDRMGAKVRLVEELFGRHKPMQCNFRAYPKLDVIRRCAASHQ